MVQGANVCFALGQVGYKVLLAGRLSSRPSWRCSAASI